MKPDYRLVPISLAYVSRWSRTDPVIPAAGGNRGHGAAQLRAGGIALSDGL